MSNLSEKEREGKVKREWCISQREKSRADRDVMAVKKDLQKPTQEAL